MRFMVVWGLGIVMAVAGCGGGTGKPSETAAPTTAAAVSSESPGPITVELSEENGSGQQGTATFEPLDDGVGITVQVNNEDGVTQHALLAEGSCADLGAPYADIFSQGGESTGGQADGTWEAERPLAFETGEPVTSADLEAGSLAVVVIDASYRGGVLEEIPDDVRLLDAPDPAGPFGESPYPLAACGELPGG